MSILWKTLIILSIVLSVGYGAWDIYMASTQSTVVLEKYIVDPIDSTLLIPVFDHLAEKQTNIYTKSEQIGSE